MIRMIRMTKIKIKMNKSHMAKEKGIILGKTRKRKRERELE
jgi:hypothetical protein